MPSPKNEPPPTTFEALRLSPQELHKCACPPDSTARGCMQMRHPHSSPPPFDNSDGPVSMAGSEDEDEECGCICHDENKEDDE